MTCLIIFWTTDTPNTWIQFFFWLEMPVQILDQQPMSLGFFKCYDRDARMHLDISNNFFICTSVL